MTCQAVNKVTRELATSSQMSWPREGEGQTLDTKMALFPLGLILFIAVYSHLCLFANKAHGATIVKANLSIYLPTYSKT